MEVRIKTGKSIDNDSLHSILAHESERMRKEELAQLIKKRESLLKMKAELD